MLLLTCLALFVSSSEASGNGCDNERAHLSSYWHNLATSVGRNVNSGSSRLKPKSKALPDGVEKACCSDCH